jgi:hypothetical protein
MRRLLRVAPVVGRRLSGAGGAPAAPGTHPVGWRRGAAASLSAGPGPDAGGADSVLDAIKALNTRIGQLDARIGQRFDVVNARFDGVTAQISGFDSRQTSRFNSLSTMMGYLTERSVRESKAVVECFTPPQQAGLKVAAPFDLAPCLGAAGAVPVNVFASVAGGLLAPVLPGALGALLRQLLALDPKKQHGDYVGRIQHVQQSLRESARVMDFLSACGDSSSHHGGGGGGGDPWAPMVAAADSLARVLLPPPPRPGDARLRTRATGPAALVHTALLVGVLRDVAPLAVRSPGGAASAAGALADAGTRAVLQRHVAFTPAGTLLLTYLACGADGAAPELELDLRGGIREFGAASSTVLVTCGEIMASETTLEARVLARSQLRALLCRALFHHAVVHHGADPATGQLRAAHGGGTPAAASAVNYDLETTVFMPFLPGGDRDGRERQLLQLQMTEAARTFTPVHRRGGRVCDDGDGGGGGADQALQLPWPDATAPSGRGVDAHCVYTAFACLVVPAAR